MLFREIITVNYENHNKYTVGAECSTLIVKPCGIQRKSLTFQKGLNVKEQ
jgi:hypothetical protein